MIPLYRKILLLADRLDTNDPTAANDCRQAAEILERVHVDNKRIRPLALTKMQYKLLKEIVDKPKFVPEYYGPALALRAARLARYSVVNRQMVLAATALGKKRAHKA